MDLHFVKVPEQFISNYTNGLFDCKYVRLFQCIKLFSLLFCSNFLFSFVLARVGQSKIQFKNNDWTLVSDSLLIDFSL